ncbi:hypothetical protein DQ384_15425 [Sphaerisporangium album]|uniref:Uncharacterized protein n=1 Tax=Sphaerisporangium album TaxID=509200 RepID=A0A367FJU8_9ACTN|nr:hypothetical protein [Sphaerisporangium album]RCG30668.1 hypothetical protein DQ384_15425 [Sphaerisporangium album]
MASAPYTGESSARLLSLSRAVSLVLRDAFAALPDDLRRDAPLVLAARDYCAWAVARYIRCHDDPAYRLRPFDAVRLEPAELIRPYAAESGWRGSCYVADDDLPGTRGRALVTEHLLRAHGGLVTCELRALADLGLDDPGFRISAVALPIPATGAAISPTRAEEIP